MKTKQLVEGLLERYPMTRNSDSLLIIGVYQALGANFTERQRAIIKSVSTETIRRLRQALQAQGKYPASPEVAAQRGIKGAMLKDASMYDQGLFQELLEKPTPDWMEGVGGQV